MQVCSIVWGGQAHGSGFFPDSFLGRAAKCEGWADEDDSPHIAWTHQGVSQGKIGKPQEVEKNGHEGAFWRTQRARGEIA
jgi:hypothetical protein